MSIIPNPHPLRPPHPMVQQLEKKIEKEVRSWAQGPSAFSCQALAESFKKNSTLVNMNVAHNGIGPEGAKAWCLARIA